MSTTTSRTARASRRSWVRWQVFGILWILVLLNYIDRATLSIALPFIHDEFHIDPVMQGVILGSFFWTYLLFQIPGGWLLDRLGPRKVIGGAAALWGLSQFLGGFVGNGTHLVAQRLALGATEAPVAPSGAKLNSSWLPFKERARGATFVDMAGPFGSAVGGLLVTWIIAVTGGWRWAFFITGAITIIVAIIYVVYLRDTPRSHPRVNEAELAHIEQPEPVGEKTTIGALPRVVDYLRSRSFWGMMFGRLGWATVWWGIISWTPSYLDQAFHFDLASLGWGTFVVYGSGVVGQLVAGFVVDRWRAVSSRHNLVMRTIFGVSGVGTAVAIFTIPGLTNGYQALVALSIAVFFINFGGLYWAIPAWLAPKEQVGTVGGVMNIASSGGGSLAPIVMGFAIAAAGGSFGGAFVFLGVTAVVYLVGSLMIDFARPMARRRGAL